MVGWAGTSAAGWLGFRQQKGLAKLRWSVGDKSALASLQGWGGGRLVRGPPCPSSLKPLTSSPHPHDFLGLHPAFYPRHTAPRATPPSPEPDASLVGVVGGWGQEVLV